VRAAVIAALNAFVGLLVSFGVALTPDQMSSLDTFLDLGSMAVLVVWARGSVTPTTATQDAESEN
jgi:hypothetical protein